MLKNERIIIFGFNAYNHLWNRSQPIANELKKRNRVIYIDPIFFSKQNIIKLHYNMNIYKESTNLYVVKFKSQIYPKTKIRYLLSKQLWNYYFSQINSILDKKPIIWINRMILWGFSIEQLREKLSPKIVIADVEDPWIDKKMYNLTDFIRKITIERIKKCDLVFTNGNSIFQLIKQQSIPAYNLPNGCTMYPFSKEYEMPSELKEFKRPFLVFSGKIDSRIDWKLIENISKKIKCTIFLIGPIVEKEMTNYEKIRNKSIIYLGKKSYNTLPKYLTNMDIGLIPYHKTRKQKYAFPSKIYEYLASGLPIITIKL